MIKQVQLKVNGMQKDMSESSFNPQFSFHNMNIRITARDKNTLLSITNEKGNKDINIIDSVNFSNTQILGSVLGYNVFNDELILFTKSSINTDYIYKLWFQNDNLICKTLYVGNLNFSLNHPIETISIYENENIKKVYFIDGLNQTRFINIAMNDLKISTLNDGSFNFVQSLDLKENVLINRNVNSSGQFPSGTIQYAFTYYNLYGQESNIFYSSPLSYTSYKNRGASPEDNVNVSFDITIRNYETRFDYIRIYSIFRSDVNATPTVKIVTDILTPEDSSTDIIFNDNGTGGEVVDPTLLLYIGGEDIIPQAFTQKDNTLFLGNLKLNRPLINESIKNHFTGRINDIQFSNRTVAKGATTNSLYPYRSDLNDNSMYIKTFKYLEWYRFGIQFQHKTGKWSEVIWIGDKQNTLHPNNNFNLGSFTVPYVNINVTDANIINQLTIDGYIKSRGVVVYPQFSERSVIAQGILNPTVFNVDDRYSNSPFAISSWFTRPNIPIDLESTGSTPDTINNNNIDKGAWLENRHHYPIPDNGNRNGEIQTLYGVANNPYTNATQSSTWLTNYGNNYFIDQSILTFHSPDIEFDERLLNMDLSNVKMRIVGAVPFTSSAGDIDITTSSAPVGENAIGLYKENIGTLNYDTQAYKSLCSGFFYMDRVHSWNGGGAFSDKNKGYMVYPWHANRSLNNDQARTDYIRTAMLEKKKLSNLKFSANTYYLDNLWNSFISGSNIKTGIGNVEIFNSNEITSIKLDKPLYSDGNELTYYGNYDKVVSFSNTALSSGYHLRISEWENQGVTTNHGKFVSRILDLFSQPQLEDLNFGRGNEPARVRFNSTPHAVFAMNYTSTGKQNILPTTIYGGVKINAIKDAPNQPYAFWNTNPPIPRTWSINQDTITLPSLFNQYGYLWLAELYNDNITNRFGGTTEEAINKNIWIPSSEPVRLLNNSNTPLSSLTLVCQEGDTYFQRYDCLKTYPKSQDDQNQVVDIVSFFCETHVNIDGRYDRNRGNYSNLSITPTNFNLMNLGYTQDNNYFPQYSLNSNRFNLSYFPNSITWTKTKTMGELIDTWTNITLASILDADGDKGKINALKNYNNELFGFQDSGIFNILFNSRTQLSTTSGVPIEIANSGKVDGKRYISDRVGTTNKWSIVQTPSGLYFIDTLSKVIYLFNGSLNNISDTLGFHSWASNNINNIESWRPLDYNNFTGHYDKEHKDIYYINEDLCLNYSELLGQFVSFFNYEKIPFMFNLNNRFFSLQNTNNNTKVWAQNEGRYNEFYGIFKPYSITWLVNPEMSIDKWFTTVEFRADRWLNDSQDLISTRTFDTIKAWNEYQTAESRIDFNRVLPSNLKKKFRIWRANIPRTGGKVGDVIRNTWTYLELENRDINYDRNILHDLVVNYIPQ